MYKIHKEYVFLLFFISFLALIFSQLYIYPPNFTATDYPVWIKDWDKLYCVVTSGSGCGELSKFPFAYLVNSFFLSFFTPEKQHFLLFLINVFFVLCSIFFLIISNGLKTKYITVFGYLFSLSCTIVFPFYIYSGALELQFGIVLGLFSVSLYNTVVRGDKYIYLFVVLAISSFLLPLYKDTSVLFMAIIGFVSLIFSVKDKLSIYNVLNAIVNARYVILFVALFLFTSLIVVVSYNELRYNSYLPVEYLIEAKETAPSLEKRVANFFWLFFSPNGGIFIAWSMSLTSLVLVLNFYKLKVSAFGVIVSGILVILNILVLSNWWTPFGWEGWGNRLIIPVMVAVLFICSGTINYSAKNKSISSGKLISYAIFTSLYLISAYYVFISYSVDRDKYLNYSLWGSNECKAMSELRPHRAMWEFKNSDIYQKCHDTRFLYVPGTRLDTSPLSQLELGEYVIKNGHGFGLVGYGWSHIEENGVWSEGKDVEIRFLPKQKVSMISLELLPFIYSKDGEQTVFVYINEKFHKEYHIHSRMKIDIDTSDINFLEDELLTLKLLLPDAISPKDVGVNTDDRPLAIKLMSLKIN